MFTYKFIVVEARDNSIRLRLTNNRKKVEISLGFKIPPDKLADALSDNPRPENVKWKSVLSLYQAKLDEIKCELIKGTMQNIDVKEIRQMIIDEIMPSSEPEPQKEETPNEGEFIKWYNKFTETHPEEASRTHRVYEHTLSRIRDYDPELNKRNFADITVSWLDSLDAFWAKSMSVNSRNHHMRNIRAVIKYAIRNDMDIRNPFDRYKIKKEETEKRSLTIEELREVFSCEVLPYAEIYRDMFKLTFMLIGINPVDLYRLTGLTKDKRVKYRRAKTHKLYSIKVEPEALDIINKYKGENALLSLSERWANHESFGKAANKALQSIGLPRTAPGRGKVRKEAKFPELTLYWARHTWATLAAELDIPDATIANALGHSSDHKTTEIYIKRNQKKVDAANRQILDWVLYNKRE